jgi:hypothetical protein
LKPLPSRIKQVLRQKNTLDNCDGIVKISPIDMKNNPLTTVLLGVLTVSALASVVLCYLFVTNTRQKNSLQSQANFIVYNRNFVGALVNDTLEYSKKNPDIDPLLESLRLKPGKSASAATNKPVTK